MEFRRSGTRDERRRRVLMDEMCGTGDAAADSTTEEAAPGDCGGTYSDLALAANQPVVTRFIPVRLWTRCVGLLSVLTLIAGIQSLHVTVLPQTPTELRATMGALNVAERGSIADWLAAMMLAVAAGYGVMAFHLRRHKLDDYRGRYRVWLWAVAVLLLASLDAITDLHLVLSGWLTQVAGTLPELNEAAWWLVTLGGFYMLVAIRMLIEMRASRAAVGFLLLGGCGYAVAVGFELGMGNSISPLLVAAGKSTGAMLGHLCLLSSLTSYCRYVYLDAQGSGLRSRSRSAKKVKRPNQVADDSKSKLNVAKAKKSSNTKSAPKSSPTESPTPAAMPKVTKKATIRVDTAHAAPSTAAGREEADQAETAEVSNLSKAERRRLRKQMRRQK